MISLTYDPQGQPKEMKLEVAGEFGLSGDLSSALKGKDAKAIMTSMKKVKTSASGQEGKKGVVTMTVDLTDPTNRNASADLLHSVGVPLLGGDGSPNPSASGAFTTLYNNQFENTNGHTHFSVTTYDTSSSTYGAGAEGGEGLTFGLNGDLTFKGERISSASYYVPSGQSMVTWKECSVK